MEKELCFNIEQEKLYLEQVLVDYMEVPIFFLCKNESAYYIALCTDFDCFNYIVCNVSGADVFALLHGKIPMRDVILKQNEFWEVISNEDIGKDIVVKKSITQLDYTVLPEEGACFEILTNDIVAYVKKFDMDFFGNENYHDNDIKVEFNEMQEVTSYKLSDIGIEDYIEVEGRNIKSVLAVETRIISQYTYNESEYIFNKRNVVIKKGDKRESKYDSDDNSGLAA